MFLVFAQVGQSQTFPPLLLNVSYRLPMQIYSHVDPLRLEWAFMTLCANIERSNIDNKSVLLDEARK